MTMTSDLFHHFKTAANYGDSITSSAARAQLKVWDQRHESQPDCWAECMEEIHSHDIWSEVTCGLSVMGVDDCGLLHDCGLLPEEKWAYIKNPRLTTEEVWQLCADESSDERADEYGRYDPADCWDGYDYYNDGYDYDDDYHDYDYDCWDYDCHYHECHYDDDYGQQEYEEEVEHDKWHEAAAVWRTTCDEIAEFDESCEPLQPEPRPLIINHHNRKNLNH